MIRGKGFFIESVSACEAGDPAAICSAAQSAGLGHVILKTADGSAPVGMGSSGEDALLPVVEALRAAGISAWGWQPVYGDEPEAEAVVACQRLQDLGLDGYVVNPGSSYARPGREVAARRFMTALRSQVDLPVALTSYRYPQYHPALPWAAFLEGCDLHMPRLTWELAHDAGAQLRESKRQCDALPVARPFVPTGAAYGPVGGWAPTQADLADFLSTARALGIDAVNFFSWDACRANLPAVWDTVAACRWPSVGRAGAPAAAPSRRPPAVPAPPADAEPLPSPDLSSGAVDAPDVFAMQFMAALNDRQPARLAGLYAADALRVRADRTLRGPAAIQEDYAVIFALVPQDTSFTLVQADLQGVVRYLTWKAGPLTGLTTLVVEDGKITLDYTHLE